MTIMMHESLAVESTSKSLLDIISTVSTIASSLALVLLAFAGMRISKRVGGMHSLMTLTTYDISIRRAMIDDPIIAILLDQHRKTYGQIAPEHYSSMYELILAEAESLLCANNNENESSDDELPPVLKHTTPAATDAPTASTSLLAQHGELRDMSTCLRHVKAIQVQLAKLSMWATVFSVVKEGFLSRAIWIASYLPYIKDEFKEPIMRETWKCTQDTFNVDFRKEMNDLMAEVEHFRDSALA